MRAIGHLQSRNGNVRYESAVLKVNGLLNHVTGVMSSLIDIMDALEEVGKDVLDRNTQMWMSVREKYVDEKGTMM